MQYTKRFVVIAENQVNYVSRWSLRCIGHGIYRRSDMVVDVRYRSKIFSLMSQLNQTFHPTKDLETRAFVIVRDSLYYISSSNQHNIHINSYIILTPG
jgi:hypothetical protein